MEIAHQHVDGPPAGVEAWLHNLYYPVQFWLSKPAWPILSSNKHQLFQEIHIPEWTRRKKRYMTTKHNTWFWTGSFCYKRRHWDNWQNLNRVWGLHNIVYQHSFPGFWLSQCDYTGKCFCSYDTLSYVNNLLSSGLGYKVGIFFCTCDFSKSELETKLKKTYNHCFSFFEKLNRNNKEFLQ